MFTTLISYDLARWGSATIRDRKSHVSIDDSIRHQLTVLARRKDARITEFSRSRPTEWRPGEVHNPEGMLATHYTDASAWELIASRLESGEKVEVIELRKPPGAKGFVMKIDLGTNVPVLYVKLQLGAGKIIGRSFHYSKHD